MKKPAAQDIIFMFFSEIAIIDQLSSAFMARLLPDGLHPSHFATLNHLMRTGDGETPIRIAQAMQVSKGTMTHTLAVLSERGLVEFRPNGSDARSKLVYLTQQGRDFRDVAHRSLEPAYTWLARNIDIAELAEMLPLLERVRSKLDDERNGKA